VTWAVMSFTKVFTSCKLLSFPENVDVTYTVVKGLKRTVPQ
jgi:hypothetical protein